MRVVPKFSPLLMLFAVTAVLLTACRTETADPTPAPTSPPPPVQPTLADPTPIPTEIMPSEPTAVAIPTPEPAGPEPTAEPQPEPENPYPFQLTADIAADVMIAEIPAPEGDASMMPFWGIYPAHVEYQLVDYALSDHFHEPRLVVYPARDFSDLNLGARENIDALRRLLAERPALTSGLYGNEPLPFLPLFNAAQVFTVHAEYQSFASGEGIRYLTHYSQAYMPIANDNLFYTFQGLTHDGAYYVAAVLPVTTADLPDINDIDQTEFFNMDSQDMDDYMRGVMDMLAETPAAAFTPSLTSLDSMMQSVALLPLEENVGDALAIGHPIAQAQLPLGWTLVVEGFAPAGTGEVEISLISGPATLITATAVANTAGQWSTELTIPTHVEGPAQLIASAGGQSVNQPVDLVLYFTRAELMANPDAYVDRPLSFHRPMAGEAAVSGTTLFFEGRAVGLMNDSLTIALLVDDCAVFAAQQSFTVTGGSGSWYGQIILPENLEPQQACAVVYTGVYGEGEWRSVQTRLPVLSPAEAVGRITLLLPLSGEGIAGQDLVLQGTAVGAPEGIALITVTTSDSPSQLLASVEVPVDNFNYWQATIPLPADSAGFVLITVTLPGLEEDTAFYQTGLIIR